MVSLGSWVQALWTLGGAKPVLTLVEGPVREARGLGQQVEPDVEDLGAQGAGEAGGMHKW